MSLGITSPMLNDAAAVCTSDCPADGCKKACHRMRPPHPALLPKTPGHLLGAEVRSSLLRACKLLPIGCESLACWHAARKDELNAHHKAKRTRTACC